MKTQYKNYNLLSINKKTKKNTINSIPNINNINQNGGEVTFSDPLPVLKDPNVLTEDQTKNLEFIKNTFIKEQKHEKGKEKMNDAAYSILVKELCGDINKFNYLQTENYTKGVKQFNKCKENYVGTANNNVILVSLHGGITQELFKLPDNINIVFLSPIKYITCGNFDRNKELLTKQVLEEYLANPSCYNKDKYGIIFNQSVIYYGGQYCIDLNLGREDDKKVPKEHTKGLFKYENNNFDTKFPVGNTNKLEVKYNCTLKELVGNAKFSFTQNYTLIFSSCREIKDYDNFIDKNTALTFYEQTLQITNFKIQFDVLGNSTYKKTAEEEYNTCKHNPITKIYLYKNDIEHIQFIRSNNKVKNNKISSRINVKINDDTEIYYDYKAPNSFITVGSLKNIRSTKNVNKVLKFDNLKHFINYEERNLMSCFIDEDLTLDYYNPCFKQRNDLLIYIFENNYNLAFEYLLYIIMKIDINLFILVDANKIIKIINTYFNEFIKSNSSKLNPTLDLSDLNLSLEEINKLENLNNEHTDYKIKGIILDGNKFPSTGFNILNPDQKFYKDIESLSLVDTNLELVIDTNVQNMKVNLLKLPKLKNIDVSQYKGKTKDDYSNKTLFVF